MSFQFVPADCPPVWMRFVPAAEDNRATEGMIHAGMIRKISNDPAGEKRAEEQVSSDAENISQNAAGVLISSVEVDSQLTECEYQRDRIPVGKERTDQLFADYFDSLNLATTTDRGRDAVVVEMRMSADQSGSPADCAVMKRIANNLPKEFSVVAGRLYSNGFRNNRLRCQKIARLYCPSSAADSDALDSPPMTRTGPRRSDRVISSQRFSNLNDDSDKGPASPIGKSLAKLFTGLSK